MTFQPFAPINRSILVFEVITFLAISVQTFPIVNVNTAGGRRRRCRRGSFCGSFGAAQIFVIAAPLLLIIRPGLSSEAIVALLRLPSVRYCDCPLPSYSTFWEFARGMKNRLKWNTCQKLVFLSQDNQPTSNIKGFT